MVSPSYFQLYNFSIYLRVTTWSNWLISLVSKTPRWFIPYIYINGLKLL